MSRLVAAIPETLRICADCEDALATGQFMCDGCRERLETDRTCYLSLLESQNHTREQLLSLLDAVEGLLTADGLRPPIEPPKLLVASGSDWTFPIALAIALTGCSIWVLVIYGVREFVLHWK